MKLRLKIGLTGINYCQDACPRDQFLGSFEAIRTQDDDLSVFHFVPELDNILHSHLQVVRWIANPKV